jgi:hypothetical protein
VLASLSDTWWFWPLAGVLSVVGLSVWAWSNHGEPSEYRTWKQGR